MGFPLTLPQAPVTAGESGHLTDHNQIQAGLSTLWGAAAQDAYNVMAPPFNAKGDGSTDDTAAIQNAITAAGTAGAGVVYLPFGHYVISSPLTVPSGVQIRGAYLYGMYPSGSTGGPAATLVASAGFSGAGMIVTSGTLSNIRIEGIVLNGSNATGSVAGISMTGAVTNTVIRQVVASTCPGTGFSVQVSGGNNAVPYFERCTAWQCGSHGFDLYTTDTMLVGCMAYKNGVNGFNLQKVNDVQFLGCRAEHNGQYGYCLTDTTITSTIMFDGCTTDQNNQHGILISGAAGNGPVQITGCSFRRDGNNAGSGSTTYAGIAVSGSTVPVIVTGTSVQAMSGDTGGYGPHYGLAMSTSSFVSVVGGYFGNDSTGKPFNWDGAGSLTTDGLYLLGVNNGSGFPGTTTTTAVANQLNDPSPSSSGYIAWTADPVVQATSAAASTAKTLYLNALYVAAPRVTTKVWFHVSTAGSGGTSGNNFAILYNSAGQVVASVGIDSSVTATGLQSFSWSASALLQPGMYWVGIVHNATSMPSLIRGSTTLLGAINGSLTAATLRTAVNGTNVTSVAAITPSSNSATNALPYWVAIS